MAFCCASSSRRLALAAVLAIVPSAVPAVAQAPHPLSTAEQQRVETLIKGMTLEQKLDYIGGTGFAVRAVPELKLPALEMSDGPYGTRSNQGFPSTTYAAGVGLAATWDREMAKRVGEGIGRDARARGVDFMLGPGVNIYRSPRNGRNFEYFGEDPFLSSQIAVGYIRGMQEQGVSATIKHYMGNNSEYLRHDSDSIIGEQALREIYLPVFEAAVKQAQVGAFMDSYNLTNGTHMTANNFLNTDILRREWGFKGVLMSDWDATYDAVGAANGGLDLEMPTGKFMNRANLESAVNAGTVKQATIDEKVRRILSTAVSFGWLDREQRDTSISVVDGKAAGAALDSARESAVLLKNEGSLLPLDKTQMKTVLVVGPDAYPGVAVGGGSAGVVPFHLVSAVEGLTNALAGSGVTVLYDRGLPTLPEIARSTSYTTPDGKPGLTLETFANDSLAAPASGSSTVQHIFVSGITIESIIDDPEVMATLFAAGAPPRKTSTRRWSGNYVAATDGDYVVVIEGSGEGSGNRVMLDGKVIFDDWDLVRAFQPSVTVHLSAGAHKLVVEDKQRGIFSGHLRFGIVPSSAIVSERAKQLAAKADVIVVSAGFDHASESEGGDRTFALPFGQDQLIDAMSAVNRKTIVAVTSGGNVDSEAWIGKVPALLETWYAGQSGGTALAEILLGDVNPSGHLPATFERRAEDNPTFNNYYPDTGSKRVEYKEGLFVGYRGYEKSHTKPLFAFGYGLSYTTFQFANLQVSPKSAGKDPQVTVAFDVTNTGKRAGAEVAQVYVGPEHAGADRPEHELKGFERVMLQPGETKHVSVALDPRSFAVYDLAKKRWAIRPGKFQVQVGGASDALPLEGTVELAKGAAETSF